MKTSLVRFFVLLSGLCLAVSAHAVDLVTVYQQALISDPVLHQADATRKANKEGVPQSVAGLLPALTGGASTSAARSKTAAPDNSINAHAYQLSLTQPLFNVQNWMQVRAAKSASKQADATYNAALQDLIMRTASAYFNVLQAQDNLHFTQAQKKAVGDQLQQIRNRYQVGTATMTDVYQAKANYDRLNAQTISAQNDILNAFEQLRQITGVTYTQLAPLKANLPLISPQPQDPQQWVRAGENNNWTLLASRYAAQAAKEDIRFNYAGHFPTVNAVGQYDNGNSAALGAGASSPTNFNGNVWKSSVGLQLNVPIFQGGLVVSKTRQAQDQYLAASDHMEDIHRQVMRQTQQTFNNVIAGISKIQADRLAVTSAKSSLEGTEAGYRAGTKTLLDVLTAEQNLYQATAALSADQYAYVLNTLALKQAAGSLSAQDVIAVNRWLQPA